MPTFAVMAGNSLILAIISLSTWSATMQDMYVHALGEYYLWATTTRHEGNLTCQGTETVYIIGPVEWDTHV